MPHQYIVVLQSIVGHSVIFCSSVLNIYTADWWCL